jgi:ParB-like chromosome segregation protein Spo0J
MSDLSYLHPQLRPLAVPVSDLTPDPRNARKRDERALEALKESIKSKGFRSTIIVQKNEDGELIIRAGNGRHQAMTELGHSHIPALVFEEGDEDAIAFAIADNRTAELAEWDFDVLSEHLTALEGELEGVGFTADEVDVLLANNSWGDLGLPDDTAVTADEDAESVPGPRHEREPPKIVVTLQDVTCRVALLRRIKEVLAEEFKGKATV